MDEAKNYQKVQALVFNLFKTLGYFHFPFIKPYLDSLSGRRLQLAALIARAGYYSLKVGKMGKGVWIGKNAELWGDALHKVTIGDNVSIDRDVYIEVGGPNAFLEIGKNSHIGAKAHILASGGVKIGKHVVIGMGTYILSATHHYEFPDGAPAMFSIRSPKSRQCVIKKPVIIEDYAAILTGSIVTPGVTIGQGAVVGAVSFVTKDIPAWTIAVGIPAHPIKERPRFPPIE